MDDLQTLVLAAVERAPEWLRHDLSSTDQAIRTRAEDAMAAIIAQAIRAAEKSDS